MGRSEICAAEIVYPGRTMLPARWVGQALGATVDWDAETQTVTLNVP
ncbi:MAG TPA: copper amine oxidase N-terminal domain-containing protein [Desulfotomaculum sp.]|nr:copper amine oxidase N-terminal domain-containing protein [Desulfotomaculum sp.]